MRNSSSRRDLFRAVTVLPALRAARAADPADAFANRVLQLAVEHRRNLARLAAHAERTGQILLAGGTWWIAGEHKGWVLEATGRAGGPALTVPLRSPEAARKGDVVWLSFSPATYETDFKTAQALEEKGCAVIAFGPDPSRGRPRFAHRLDSLTRWEEDERLTQMGNLLSLWSLTGEVAGCTARHGRTLVMLQSAVLPGASARNATYQRMRFHEDGIRMRPVLPGVLGRAYLNFVNTMLGAIHKREMSKLRNVAEEIRHAVRQSRPAVLRPIGHLMPRLVEQDSGLFRISTGGGRELGSLADLLPSSRLLVWLGYARVPPQLVSAVRNTGVKAAWIVASDAAFGLEQDGDVVIDQHWKIGDAAVQAPGYDVPILPPSAVAQLFIYEILVRAARR